MRVVNRVLSLVNTDVSGVMPSLTYYYCYYYLLSAERITCRVFGRYPVQASALIIVVLPSYFKRMLYDVTTWRSRVTMVAVER